MTECPAGDCTVTQLMPVNPGGVQPGESTVLGRAAVIEQHLWLRLPDPGGLGFGCSGDGRQQHIEQHFVAALPDPGSVWVWGGVYP